MQSNISNKSPINLNSINFGGLSLNNIRASVVQSQNAPLLLGQSVLQRLGKIEIDNSQRILKITTKQWIALTCTSFAFVRTIIP